MIQIKNLTWSWPGSIEPVFENLSLYIDPRWKLGLIGRNGRGKSTLLNLLCDYRKYPGMIFSDVDFEMFPQTVKDQDETVLSVMENLCPEAEMWQMICELSYFDLDESFLERIYSTLSGGEKTKVLLTALFLKEGKFRLIDEPTNHLDLEGRKQLAQYLKSKTGFILVSHDRWLLDESVDHIFALNRSSIDLVSGNYSSWKMNFDRQIQNEKTQNDKLKKEIRRLDHSARQSAQWSERIEKSKTGAFDKGFVGHKSAKMMKRSMNAQTRKEKALSRKKELLHDLETVEPLKIHPLDYPSKTLIHGKDLQIYYDGKAVFDPLTFQIDRGQQVFLEGVNGSGKSSLISLICSQPLEYTGEIQVGSNLIISRVHQHSDDLKGSLKDFVIQRGIDENLFKSILRKLGFDRNQFEYSLENYSMGQKKKVMIAASLCESAHLYIWDEPFNYLDIESRIQIEEMIKTYHPTLLVVEHDQMFKDSVASKTIGLSRANRNIK